MPIRTIETKREWLEDAAGHVLPRRLTVSVGRGRRTEVEFYHREMDADIPDGIFSVSYLTRKGR